MNIAHVSLPWPDPVLSPNNRAHWSRKAKAKATARAHAGWAAVEAGAKKLAGFERLSAVITFYPPNRIRRDTDNMLASIKSQLDGIADVCGVDDSRWQLQLIVSEPVKPGRVVVSLRPLAKQEAA